MFIAHDYFEDRYAGQEVKPTEQLVLRLQEYVNASGLSEQDAFVKTVLNAITPDLLSSLTMREMPPIGTMLQWAAALLALNGPWEEALTDYIGGLPKEGKLIPTEFYKHCMDTDFLPLNEVDGLPFKMSTPLVFVWPPAVSMTVGNGNKAGYYYVGQEEITIGFGLFEVLAGVELPKSPTAPITLKLGVIQFATANRVTKYEGLEVHRTFKDALDSSVRPWLGGTFTHILPGPKAVLEVRDAPKLSLPTSWQKKEKLLSMAVDDTYTTHVVVETRPKTFAKLYTVDWTFSARYDAAHPETATHSYQITSQGPASGQITLTNQEQTANGYPDVVMR